MFCLVTCELADPTLRSLKPCVPAPTCSVHKCRHRNPRCPDPDACYSKCKSLGIKCPHAADVVNPRGKECKCVEEVSQSMRRYRPGEEERARTPYRKWVESLYTKRSKVSRWVDDDDDGADGSKKKKGKKKKNKKNKDGKGRCDIL